MGITHVIRGEDLIDSTHRVLALRHALVGGTGAPTTRSSRTCPLIVDAESRAKLSKRHGAVALEDFVDRRLPPRGAHQLPRAARVGTGRRRPRGDGRRRAVAAVRPRPGDARGRRLRPRQARLAQRRVDPSARARRPGGARRCRWRGRASATTSIPRSSPQAVALAQERAVTLVQIVDQMAFLFVDDDDSSRSRPSRGRRSSAPTASREILDAVIAHVETCDWTVDGARAAAGHRGARHQVPEGRAGGVRRGRGSPPRACPCSTRCILLGRERTLARLRAARDRLALTRSLGVSGGPVR